MNVLLVSLACAAPLNDAAPQAAPSVASAATPAPKPEKLAASEILVSFVGAAGAPASVTRTDAEAKALAEQLWGRAQQGEAFDALARASSDGPAAPRGGALGVWRTGTMIPELEDAVAALRVGDVGRPFRTPYGWHVVRRDAVIEIEARHILIPYAGSWRSGATRTKEEARALAEAALRELEGGAPFASVAAKYSEDATAQAGGALGTIAPGQLVPAFEDAAFALAVGQRSRVVETPYGFHLVERTR